MSCHPAPATTDAPTTTLELGRKRRPLVVVVGNPNVGKTTLFNRLTGQNARVGNYPGITVERAVGTLTLGEPDEGESAELVDVPGAYSLSARSPEEQIAIQAVLGLGGNPKPELAVVVVDAGQLVRNLYLVLQLVELRVPVVIALNMIDEVRSNPPITEAIAKYFGVPCVATNGRSGEGLHELRVAIREALRTPARGSVKVPYPPELMRDVDRVGSALPAAWRSNVERDRALALWALTSIDKDDELVDVEPSLRERCLDVQADARGRDLDSEIIGARYALLDGAAQTLYERPNVHPPKRAASERVDKVLLHPLYGFAAFIVLMFAIFQTLFSWSEPAIGAIEVGVGWLQDAVRSVAPEGLLRDLLTEGVIAGVGNVVVFLPQILLLFAFIGLLEDTGYMSRVAYLMDRVMKALGLHGRAFVPMLSGFACAVPAILATRTMERQRDRLLTMLVVPLMTCSARLPVYTLIIVALFPPSLVLGFIPAQGLMMLGMYLFATATTLIAAAVIGRTAVRGKRVPLILELPPYRLPHVPTVGKMIWDRTYAFIREAGTIILFCTIVLWGLLSFPRSTDGEATQPDKAMVTAISSASDSEAHGPVASSYAGRMGRALEPVLEPLGFDWKIGIGLIGAFAAREVFVSTLAIVYGIEADDEDTTPLRDRVRSEKRADGSPFYTPLMGLSLLVFFSLACQCMSTLAVVRRETKTVKWPLFMFAYMTTAAYVASLLVYQGGKLLGF